MANEQGIKVKDLEQAARLREGNRLLILTDEENNEVKTVSKENTITSLISTVENNLITDNGGLFVDGNTIAELVTALKQIQAQQDDEIGRPIRTLSNTLLDNEIWLEGGLISTTDEDYAKLVEVYGTTYNNGSEPEGYIRLPDYRNRVGWGASNFGYLEPTLPNIKGEYGNNKNGLYSQVSTQSGALYGTQGNLIGGGSGASGQNTILHFDASRSSSIYQDGATNRPPSIKERVKTRYK